MNNKILITGATSGIGREFTNIYAQRNCDLVLISKHNSAQKLIDFTKDIEIDVLINNAGVGVYGELIKSDINAVNSMITLNISSLVDLTYYFAKEMAKKGRGKILNVASTAAFQPIPNFAAYAASKAFVLCLETTATSFVKYLNY